jgi:hypothetical protein
LVYRCIPFPHIDSFFSTPLTFFFSLFSLHQTSLFGVKVIRFL